jgi:hypothetical protein
MSSEHSTTDAAKVYGNFATKTKLKRGSDVEIANEIAKDLRKKHANKVLASEGEFWRYAGTQWELIPQSEINRTVQSWDGKTFGKDDDIHSINLSFAKIKSIIGCLTIEMQRDGFFDAPEAGINCRSGFIKFDLKTFKPRLVRHSADHRQRQTVAAEWKPADELRALPEKSLANKLLTGCFKDDVDAAEKIDLLGENAGAIVLGYGTRHKAPKAMVFLG